jgi:class 3 adenylate cyclase
LGSSDGATLSKISWTEEEREHVATEKTAATVFYGVFRKVGAWVDEKDPEILRQSLNDFYVLVSSRAREFTPTHSADAVFEAFQGGAFSVSWRGEVAQSALWAMSLAIQLRKDFQQLNESRKVDGLPEIHYGFGIHCGAGVYGGVGEAKKERPTLITWVHQGARALENIAEISGRDGLVSRDVWQHVAASFLGSSMGEAKLCNETGLVEYYHLAGYRGEDQQEVWVETPYSKSEPIAGALGGVESAATVKRWLVNNGSQMVGPLTQEEIAGQLFSQELDFDCECWSEGTGKSSQIEKAGIFGAANDSTDDSAIYWVFDGKTIHGPMTRGLVMTALTRGALAIDTSFVCEKSTIKGWVSGKTFIVPSAPQIAQTALATVETDPSAEGEKEVA